MFETTKETAFRDLEKLIKLSILKKKGEKKGTYYSLDV
jgi:predicted HTH transcriptional regulator